MTGVQVAYGARMDQDSHSNTPERQDPNASKQTHTAKELPPFVFAFQVNEICYDKVSDSPNSASFVNKVIIPDMGLPAKLSTFSREGEDEKYHHEIVGLICEKNTAKRLGHCVLMRVTTMLRSVSLL